jgi:ribosomal-protein-alanine N-acetyltransferase
LPWPASAYQYEINQNPLSLLWVAETRLRPGELKIVGMIVVWLIVDEAHIATLAVHPEHRSKGFARSLLTTALIESIHKGMRDATLEVRASNLVAQRLYQEFHFEIVGRRPRYYRDNNEDALIMTINNMNQTYLDWLESLKITGQEMNDASRR